jgi:hypothetical protein
VGRGKGWGATFAQTPPYLRFAQTSLPTRGRERNTCRIICALPRICRLEEDGRIKSGHDEVVKRIAHHSRKQGELIKHRVLNGMIVIIIRDHGNSQLIAKSMNGNRFHIVYEKKRLATAEQELG